MGRWHVRGGRPALLPPSHMAVLQAMTRPDPGPPADFDSAGEAIHRRQPSITAKEAADILHVLNALGLTNVPYVRGTITAARLADLRQSITGRGWEVLGVATTAPAPN